jgi:hypothetical protein
MKRFLIVSVVAAVAGLWIPQASGSDRSGIVSGQFLKIPVSARMVAMGGAGVALVDGAACLAYNPSGMVYGTEYQFAAHYTQWFTDIRHSFFAFAANLEGIGAVGIGATILSSGDMMVTTPAYPEGTGEYFRASDYALTLALARKISDKFSVGISMKYIKSYLFNTEYGASCFAFDAGTLYEIPALRTRLGMAVANLGSDMKFINESYSLPTSFRFGVVTNIMEGEEQNLNAAFQISRPNDGNEQYNVGAEYTFFGNFTLRAGHKFGYDAENWTAGFGVNFALIGVAGMLDYGYNNFKWLPGTHAISLYVGL